jgi:acyl-CoA synthetase (AMP-forming)/AMP-acid ligase II
MASIEEMLKEHALKRPLQAAIIDTARGKARTTTYDGLYGRVRAVSALLSEYGIEKGDPVLVFQPMSAELYIAMPAIFRIGAIAMFLDPSSGRKHIEQCCEIYPPKALIASSHAHLLRLISPTLNHIPIKFSIGPSVWGAHSLFQKPVGEAADCSVTVNDDLPALLTFTSGSTGQPKAALRTHGFLRAQHNVLAKTLNLCAGTVDLTTLPVFVLANLASGVTSVIPDANMRHPGRINGARVLRQIEKTKPSTAAGSPAFFERLIEECKRQSKALSSFESIYTGGAPVFPAMLDRLHKTAPNAKIVAVYGSTEAEPIAHIERDAISDADRQAMLSGKGLIAGIPVNEIAVKIIRHQWGVPIGSLSQGQFGELIQHVGNPGEIVVSGDHVLRGYLHGTGDEETKFRVDNIVWHRTGDSGVFDRDGRLWLLGRCSARIEDSDGILYPFAVEAAAAAIPGIRRTALIAQNEKRILIVECSKKGLDLPALRKSLEWAKISEIKIINRIPVDRRHNAKIDYPALARLIKA